MTVKKKTKSAAPAAKAAPKAKKTDAATKKSAAKSGVAGAKTAKTATKSPAPAKKRATPARKSPAEAEAPAAKSKTRIAKVKQESAPRIDEPVLDPIGDVSNGEAHKYLGETEKLMHTEAEVASVKIEALEAGPGMTAAAQASQAEDTEAAPEEEESGTDRKLRPAANPERLQKILSQAGIASRRHAEEMIVAGRVMVNGQVVTQLGSKADLGRDHIRVDGKLLQGAERHRYFMLNKPRGYVTTMSDPEHRPTVMEFFAKAKERVYPVGRLDYLSEGLLLMTNDGELANLLSKAGSGVEKTYLVKVAGKPSAEELERLRGGVTIEKGEPGSARVRTAPARVREFREGDNPWFEVVLTEGRNRELRKMFAAIGHFAEKIRRVGYGPLVLDVEPGNMRELAEDEVNALRLTAEGKMKPRRPRIEKLLPKEAGVAAEKRGQSRDRKFDRRPAPRQERGERPFNSAQRPPFKPRGDRPEFRGAPRQGRGERPFNGAPRAPFKPRSDRPDFRPAPRQDRGERPFSGAPRAPFKPRSDRPDFRPAPRQEGGEKRFSSAPRAPFKPRGDRPDFRPAPRQEGGEKRFSSAPRAPFKPRGDRPEFRSAPRQDRGERPFSGAPRAPFKPRSDRPEFRSAPRQDRGENRFASAPRAPFKPRSDRPEFRPSPRPDRGEARPRIEIERVAEFQKGPEVGGSKPKPSFGSKPNFSGRPSFGGKPGSAGKYRGNTKGGPKRGASRPGAPRGGRKRG
ncbi:MAG: pseudouridine synthase [Xanthobacteraceae bacterium]|nr:pseudouridine synthase [Xanthobacteraceae bacterium]